MRCLDRLRTAARDERGVTVPLAVIVLAIVLVAATAAVSQAVFSRHDSQNVVDATRAQQAADSGLRVALYEYNSLAVDTGALLTQSNGVVNGVCYAGSSSGAGVPTLAGSTSGTVNWCPPVTNGLGDGVKYSYVISPANQTVANPSGGCLLLILCFSGATKQSTVTRTVVSSGTAGGATRVSTEQAQLTGQTQLQCLVQLGPLCITLGRAVAHITITQYYQLVPGTYRRCSAAAAAVPAGQDPTTSNC